MLADFVNGNDIWIIQTRCSFRFQPESLKARWCGPLASLNNLQRDYAVETFLSCAINYPLTSPTDFLQQFVIAQDPGISVSNAATILPFAAAISIRGGRSARPGSLTRSTASEKSPRPVSSRQAVQSPSAASAKISAPHFEQTLDTNFIICSNQTRMKFRSNSRNSCLYDRKTVIRCRNSSSISLGSATVWPISSRNKS